MASSELEARMREQEQIAYLAAACEDLRIQLNEAFSMLLEETGMEKDQLNVKIAKRIEAKRCRNS